MIPAALVRCPQGCLAAEAWSDGERIEFRRPVPQSEADMLLIRNGGDWCNHEFVLTPAMERKVHASARRKAEMLPWQDGQVVTVYGKRASRDTPQE